MDEIFTVEDVPEWTGTPNLKKTQTKDTQERYDTITNTIDTLLLGSYPALVMTLTLVLFTFFYFRSRRPRDFPPGPPVLPLVGSLPFWSVTQATYFRNVTRMHNKYGDVFSLKMGKVWVWIVRDYHVLREVFHTRGLDFAGRPFTDVYHRFKFMNKEKRFGILYGDCDAPWRKQREAALSVIHKLCNHGNRVEEIIAMETEKLCEEISSKDGDIIDICDLLDICSTNVLCSLLFGIRYEASDESFKDFRKFLHYTFYMLHQNMEMDWIPVLRRLSYYKNKLVQLSRVHYFLHDVIEGNLQRRSNNYMGKPKEVDDTPNSGSSDSEGEPQDFIEGYLRELEKDETMEDLSRQITMEFFQAGMETMTDTLGWGFYYMLKHPDKQAQVQEEIDRVVGRHKEVVLEDRKHLHYTEACLAEINRLSSVSPMAMDHKATADTHVAGYRITEGTVIWGNLYAIMRDPEVFPEPELFKPERYIHENGSYKPNSHVINFGIGKRSCVGEQLARREAFLIFTRVLHKFTLSVRTGYTHPPPRGTYVITHVPPPYYVVAKHRR